VVPLLASALVVAAAVVLVARPFLSAGGATTQPAKPLDDAGLALVEERDRTLAELRELEFDHRTGKVSDADYRASIGPLRRRAAAAVRAVGD
jgi:hypothetical protein